MTESLDDWMTLLSVAEAGSITAAANALGVSQPGVSRTVSRLEKRIGRTLLDRNPRGVVPTAEGKLLLDFARRISALADEAQAAVRDADALRGGRLSVGATPSLATHFLPDVLLRFRRRFPEITTRLEVEPSDQLLTRLQDGAIQLAYGNTPGGDAKIRVDLVMQDDLVAIATADHPLRRRKQIPMKVFAAEPLIARLPRSAQRSADTSDQSFAGRALAALGVNVRPILTLDSFEAVKRAVVAGLGVALVSRLSIATELKAKELVILDVKSLPLRRPVYALRIKDRLETKPMRAFACLVRDRARSEKSVPANGA